MMALNVLHQRHDGKDGERTDDGDVMAEVVVTYGQGDEEHCRQPWQGRHEPLLAPPQQEQRQCIDDIDDALGRNIQTIRMSKNMTQNEVVAQMQLLGSNMSRSTLANIETGRRNNKVSDLKLLKKVLSTSYDDFFAN